MKPLDDDEVPTDSLTRELQSSSMTKYLHRKSKWRESSMVTSVKVSMDTSPIWFPVSQEVSHML
ncbi:hypothetical protein pdam_00024932 [Pocillopora damicornis]|uniref:Uncharacterized protein n=1 Tax=Pocillopora damicornis TaxID=46731 RepID=A0A3M6UGR0_POCDA|nr:hypothetical protein pdam_00024932 [Pocillopora damicornis]